MFVKTLSVGDVNNYIKRVIDNDFILNNISVKGEISNFKFHNSGHIYFSLKDENSKINCVMFRNAAEKLGFLPENGMNVIIKGRVSIYHKEGTYQVYCEEMKMDGIGELYIAFENLKNRLQSEGLFDIVHKKPIPKYVKKIGVITSPTGAAIRDIINVVRRRNKYVDIIIYPALVQGINCSEDIIKGLKVLNNVDDIDVILIARGGGSIEELWGFNDEKLAYEIFNSCKPIITGVGHETDFTIVDFVSDLRAPTPSAAAEIAVFSIDEFESTVNNLSQRLSYMIKNKISDKYEKLRYFDKSLELNNPIHIIANAYNDVDKIINDINFRIVNRINNEKEYLGKMNALLCAHNPLNILNKGFAVIKTRDDKVIKDINYLKRNNNIKITLKDGTVNALVKYDKDT